MELIEPSMAYAKSFEEAIAEFNGEHVHGFVLDHPFTTVASAIEEFRQHAKGERLPKDWVPASTYWLVDDHAFIAIVNIRHRLNAALELRGGHIGYAVRPTKQQQGYGTELLRLSLMKAKDLGIQRVLITCSDDNIGSRRVIEKNGGILQDKIIVEGENVLRFWIQNA